MIKETYVAYSWIGSFPAHAGHGTVFQTVPDQGFFEDGTISLEVKTFPLSIDKRTEKANCYVAWLPESRQAVVVDPGRPEVKILEFIRARHLKVLAILNTHGHFDHCAGGQLPGSQTLRAGLPPASRQGHGFPGGGSRLSAHPLPQRSALDPGWLGDRSDPHSRPFPGSVCLKIGRRFSPETLSLPER